MRILYLTDQVYLHGGAERILTLKLNHFIEFYDYDVHLLTTEQKIQIAIHREIKCSESDKVK